MNHDTERGMHGFADGIQSQAEYDALYGIDPHGTGNNAPEPADFTAPIDEPDPYRCPRCGADYPQGNKQDHLCMQA